jgi:hypothetical protein
MSTNIYKKLSIVQSKLNAPKNQRNNFGGYNYRSAEDILEAVKPLLSEVEATIVISDEIVQIANRIYVKATAVFTDENQATIPATAFAREEETKKGMDASQITGSASSYARKYALNGLLLIDDNKDADATNTHGKTFPQQEQKPAKAKSLDARRNGLKLTFANNLSALEALLAEMDILESFGTNSREEIFKAVDTMSAEQIDEFKKLLKEHQNG